MILSLFPFISGKCTLFDLLPLFFFFAFLFIHIRGRPWLVAYTDTPPSAIRLGLDIIFGTLRLLW